MSRWMERVAKFGMGLVVGLLLSGVPFLIVHPSDASAGELNAWLVVAFIVGQLAVWG